MGILVGALLFLLGTAWAVYDLFVRVPDFTKLKDSVEISIRLANGDKSTRVIGPRTANWTPLSAISEYLPRAVVSSEDGTFYSHKGIDVYEMQEAFKKDLKEGRFARGASTLTQQVLKNVYLLRYPKIWRKVKEIVWASKLEEALTKPQILAFYLNMAEWGPGIYGVGEASRHYFATSPSSLTARQAAFLAMLLPSPRRYHAFFREKRLTQWANGRVNRILQVMNKLGQLPEEEYAAAMSEKLWGASVLEDGAPGAPKDPGWNVSESPDEVFESAVAKEVAPAPEEEEVTAIPSTRPGPVEMKKSDPLPGAGIESKPEDEIGRAGNSVDAPAVAPAPDAARGTDSLAAPAGAGPADASSPTGAGAAPAPEAADATEPPAEDTLPEAPPADAGY